MQYVHALGCKISFASVAHPRNNGQDERANTEVLRGLKTRTFDTLQKHNRRWIDELQVVLWSLRTTPNRATGQTPFSLVYGAEVVIPMELIYGMPRVLAYDEVVQDQHRRDDGVLIKENHLWSATRAARYQQALRCYHSHRVHARCLRKVTLSLGAFSPPRVQTSCHLSGKALTGYYESPDLAQSARDRRWHSVAKLMEY